MSTEPFGWRARVKHEAWEYSDAAQLWLWRGNMDRSIVFAQPIQFMKHEDRAVFVDPPPFIGHARGVDFEDGATAMIQAIVDAAHEAGFRPKGMEPVTNQLAATNRHLEDMRALVANTHGPLPGLPYVQPPTVLRPRNGA